ncbi:CoA-binding protein [Chloroflexota bacterium]
MIGGLNVSVNLIEEILHPRSIAVVGANQAKGWGGGGFVESLLEFEFKGKIFPVNPKYSEIMGIEKTSGKHWKELPDDYMVPAGGDGPRAYSIIISHGMETAIDRFGGSPMGRQGFSIDAWR